MHCCTPISNLLMLTTAYAYNPFMLAEIPHSHHSSSSSSEDSLLNCSDSEFNTSPEKSSPIKRPAPTPCPVSPVSLLTACSPPLKFTIGAIDVRLWDAAMSSSAGDPMVTPRAPLKTHPTSSGRSEHSSQPHGNHQGHETDPIAPLPHLP